MRGIDCKCVRVYDGAYKTNEQIALLKGDTAEQMIQELKSYVDGITEGLLRLKLVEEWKEQGGAEKAVTVHYRASSSPGQAPAIISGSSSMQVLEHKMEIMRLEFELKHSNQVESRVLDMIEPVAVALGQRLVNGSPAPQVAGQPQEQQAQQPAAEESKVNAGTEENADDLNKRMHIAIQTLAEDNVDNVLEDVEAIAKFKREKPDQYKTYITMLKKQG